MSAHSVQGFKVSGVRAGLKSQGKLDVALIASERPCTAAGVFTANRVKAAPVLYDQQILADPTRTVRAVVANAGNANACTGKQGLANVGQSAKQAAEALGCQADEVLVLSTGVIGVQLPMEVLLPGVTQAASELQSEAWEDAAQAIMTTDTRMKIASLSTEVGYTITGIAKGAGMIAPNMATMLAVIATDAAVAGDPLQAALSGAVQKSFNRIVIDGDMSTNDTVLVLANGASGMTVPDGDRAFQAALESICIQLAQAIVRDGEGATKFVTLEVTSAASDAEARAAAHSIARSPLCKTAFYGGDPNWGRILCAAGYAGVQLLPDQLRLWMLAGDGSVALQLVEAGQPCDYDEQAAIALMQGPEWGFRLDLGSGDSAATVWTCDLSHEYVTVNGHYRT